ncbi:hypothetical protein DMUE_5139 [Dictyocoela muelleri]|nr:hypothetical protein DMUE_5139 [Dictyocoela muelleri]
MDEEFLTNISEIDVSKIIQKVKKSIINEKKIRRLIIYLSQDEEKFIEFIEKLTESKIYILFLIKYIMNNKERSKKYSKYLESYLKVIKNKKMDNFKFEGEKNYVSKIINKNTKRNKKSERRSEIKEFKKLIKNNNRDDDLKKEKKKEAYNKMIKRVYSNLYKQ